MSEERYQSSQIGAIGSLPSSMPGVSTASDGSSMMLDQNGQWGPGNMFGDKLLEPYGYQKFPGGFMMQWGTTQTLLGYGYANNSGYSNYNINNSSNILFYKPFDYLCFGVYGNGSNNFTYNSNYGSSGTGGYSYNTAFPSAGITFNSITRFGFQVYNNTPMDTVCKWFAVGR